MAPVAFSEFRLCPISCSKLPLELPSSKLPTKRFDGNAYNYNSEEGSIFFPNRFFF